MDGVFNFDADGIATALSGPQWSLDALRAVNEQIARAAAALSSEKVSDLGASVVESRILHEIRKRDENLAQIIRDATKGKPRHWAARFYTTLMTAIGSVVTVKEGGELGYEAIQYILRQFFHQ